MVLQSYILHAVPYQPGAQLVNCGDFTHRTSGFNAALCRLFDFLPRWRKAENHVLCWLLCYQVSGSAPMFLNRINGNWVSNGTCWNYQALAFDVVPGGICSVATHQWWENARQQATQANAGNLSIDSPIHVRNHNNNRSDTNISDCRYIPGELTTLVVSSCVSGLTASPTIPSLRTCDVLMPSGWEKKAANAASISRQKDTDWSRHLSI